MTTKIDKYSRFLEQSHKLDEFRIGDIKDAFMRTLDAIGPGDMLGDMSEIESTGFRLFLDWIITDLETREGRTLTR